MKVKIMIEYNHRMQCAGCSQRDPFLAQPEWICSMLKMPREDFRWCTAEGWGETCPAAQEYLCGKVEAY